MTWQWASNMFVDRFKSWGLVGDWCWPPSYKYHVYATLYWTQDSRSLSLPLSLSLSDQKKQWVAKAQSLRPQGHKTKGKGIQGRIKYIMHLVFLVPGIVAFWSFGPLVLCSQWLIYAVPGTCFVQLAARNWQLGARHAPPTKVPLNGNGNNLSFYFYFMIIFFIPFLEKTAIGKGEGVCSHIH